MIKMLNRISSTALPAIAIIFVVFVVGVVFSPAYAQEVQTRRYDTGDNGSQGDVSVRRIRQQKESPRVGEQPIGFAVMPSVETPDQSWDVVLLRFNLFVGRHRCVYGLDLGILGGFSDVDMGGLAVSGLFNDCGGSSGSLQIAGIVNHSAWDFSGLQLAAGMSWTEGMHTGLQLALANNACRLSGVQIGAFNFIEQGSGLQIGIYNGAECLEGFQIGLINVNRDSSVPVMPVLNFAF